ncbi:phospholipid-transporting ATPase ID-like isoform X2 [Oryzias latipes]
MQNSGTSTFKRTRIDCMMNILVLCIGGFLVTISAILSVWYFFFETTDAAFTVFLPRLPDVSVELSSFLIFCSYVIVLNTLVPMSLYVSLEIICFGNSLFINWDRDMYCPRTNTPARARTTKLSEELGQVKYILSDKTGTLTRNIMTFIKCCIEGKAYGEPSNSSGHQIGDSNFIFHDPNLVELVRKGNPEAQAFFRLLALCHTVMSEEKEDGELIYQAQSPDESALVTAARSFGFEFRSRTPETITLMEMGNKVIYDLVAVLDFTNRRKRMSVIVCSPEGKTTLLCKGADTVVFERLHSFNHLKEATQEHLNKYAQDGLRALVLSSKQLEESYVQGWKERLHEASIAMEGREERLEELFEEIEKDMTLLGATAVEDELQEGVPHTIEQLGQAHIKIWMLTGDQKGTKTDIFLTQSSPRYVDCFLMSWPLEWSSRMVRRVWLQAGPDPQRKYHEPAPCMLCMLSCWVEIRNVVAVKTPA